MGVEGGGGGATAGELAPLGLLFDCPLPSAAGAIGPEILPDLHFDLGLTALEDFSTAPAFGWPSLADLGFDCLPLIREKKSQVKGT